MEEEVVLEDIESRMTNLMPRFMEMLSKVGDDHTPADFILMAEVCEELGTILRGCAYHAGLTET